MEKSEKNEYLNMHLRIKKKPFFITLIVIVALAIISFVYIMFFHFVYPVVFSETENSPISQQVLDKAKTALEANGIRYVITDKKDIIMVCKFDGSKASEVLDNAGVTEGLVMR